ncbi:hypothetical protein AJ79_09928 [Helicocarpus griseus UAMH5409]|uniref:Uncharacterized protein n=1 Tax=Helicocarpus griseus UAMH5409 TaxID=1447875 RepID=A0A2B7WGC8_9EURO|nr:hypothetical protein AJ79_09928 [Helicocarpus griseus UAMH5409]
MVSKRRAMNRSSEDCYASPLVPILIGPSQRRSPPPKRQKRTSGSSSDSDEIVNGIRAEDFRVGGPYLCNIPAVNSDLPQGHPAVQKYTPHFEKEITNRLDRHSVDWKSLRLVDRRSERYEDSGKTETVVVSATRDKLDNSWLKACLEIRSFFLLQGLFTLNIEIIDKRASLEMYTFPTFEYDKIHAKWNEISSRILQIIGTEGWLTLKCFRRGTNPDREDNPPTVLLTVPIDSTKRWKAERDRISDLLDSENLREVAVEVLRGALWRMADVDLTSDVLPDNAWEMNAQLGMSIGPHASDYSGSTFGGFLELLLCPKTDEWLKFGVTCYQCVEPECGKNAPQQLVKDVELWREKGMSTKMAKKANILIDQPALKDHQARMRMTEENKKGWSEIDSSVSFS